MSVRLPLKQHVRVKTDGPFKGTSGHITEYLGAKTLTCYGCPTSFYMYRVALSGQATPLTFADTEIEAIK